MQSDEIRSRFLNFFKEKGHKILPSSSLIPENDPSVLFTTAGMQQFKKYYTNPKDARKDFGSLNVATVQKCVRTGDIDEVGDSTHLTFFEMLGNFSFGGYGRKEAIEYAYEFIVKELGLEISYVTIYKGSKNVPKDAESEKIWEKIGIKNIREEGEDVFWGPTGDSGPCGPTTEIYCKNTNGEDVEIWNIVFNEYFCDGSREQLDKGEAKLTKLPILGVDTGMGLERLVSIVQKKESVYETDLFEELILKVKSELGNYNEPNARVIADHLRTAFFMVTDGIVPSNKDRGYVLRRLIRRSIVRLHKMRMSGNILIPEILNIFLDKYKNIYPEIYSQKNIEIILDEVLKFKKRVEEGLKEFEKGIDPFVLATTYGFPIELTLELAKEKGKNIDLKDFNKKMTEHQKLSQTASAGMFKGGLVNHNEKTIKLHTAHHLLLAGLQAVVDKNIKQRGSNITEERLRMDFLSDHKLTDEEKKKVEDWVNQRIKEDLIVVRKEMPLKEAEKLGAEMEFGMKYPETVSVYFIMGKNSNIFSKEFCGGPHVSNTSILGHFKILKEEAVSAGVRRIKAVLE
jgi:alanyl-tRNA synthetase